MPATKGTRPISLGFLASLDKGEVLRARKIRASTECAIIWAEAQTRGASRLADRAGPRHARVEGRRAPAR